MELPVLLTCETRKPRPNRTKRMLQSARRVGWNTSLVSLKTPKQLPVYTHRVCVRMYAEALRSFPRDQLVVLSDASDVLVVRGPHDFADAWRKVGGGRLLASAQPLCGGVFEPLAANKHLFRNCAVLGAYWTATLPPGEPLPARRFVSSGLLAGTVRALLDWTDLMIASGDTDDQVSLALYANQYPDRVALDVNADVLHTTVFAGTKSDRWQRLDAPTFADVLGIGSFFLHFPGPSQPQHAVYESVAAAIDRGPDPRTFSNLSAGAPKWEP